MSEPTLAVIALLALAAVVAGFVDAVVGGGGLIQLPALLVGLPGASPVQVLATNKVASISGTTVAAATYYRRIRPDPRTFVPLMIAALVGSVAGAFAASLVSRDVFTPVVLVALVVVGAYVVARPELGEATELRLEGARHRVAAVLVGLVVGFYDGVLGPGTGSFFVIALVSVLGYDFLQASAKTRLANWMTNAGALLVFLPQGAVVWKVALAMAAGNLLGGYVGARTAVARGSRFVRAFFLLVVAAFVVRLGGDVLGVW